jgi:hypothetical protein
LRTAREHACMNACVAPPFVEAQGEWRVEIRQAQAVVNCTF